MTGIRRAPQVVPSWPAGTRTASASAVVVALLLFMPIQIRDAGDHETRSCGNAVSMNLARWRGGGAGDYYYETAFKACTTKRINRLAEAVVVVSATVLVLTVLAGRRRRPDELPLPTSADRKS